MDEATGCADAPQRDQLFNGPQALTATDAVAEVLRQREDYGVTRGVVDLWAAQLHADTDTDAMRAKLKADRDALTAAMVGEHAGGQVRRVAQRFAQIGAAGELATSYGITGWPAGEAKRAAVACFEAWRADRDTEGNSEPDALLSQVRKPLVLLQYVGIKLVPEPALVLVVGIE